MQSKKFVLSATVIEPARSDEAGAISALLNRAYRGESSRIGWTTEADLIAGEVRTDEAEVSEVISKPGSIFLVHRSQNGIIEACVNLQDRNGKAYLGMFAVEPGMQNSGIGRAMLGAAEKWAQGKGCRSIYMYVISLRVELIEWYARCGYLATGERVPFPEDGRSGSHRRTLEFLILEKGL